MRLINFIALDDESTPKEVWVNPEKIKAILGYNDDEGTVLIMEFEPLTMYRIDSPVADVIAKVLP